MRRIWGFGGNCITFWCSNGLQRNSCTFLFEYLFVMTHPQDCMVLCVSYDILPLPFTACQRRQQFYLGDPQSGCHRFNWYSSSSELIFFFFFPFLVSCLVFLCLVRLLLIKHLNGWKLGHSYAMWVQYDTDDLIW